MSKKTVVAYKGFNANLQCRNYQFEIGKSYAHNGSVKLYQDGFHSCENPLDVFDYYTPGESRFAIVESGGEIDREVVNGSTKIASSKIHILAEIKIPDLVSAAVKWITDKCLSVLSEHTAGDRSASSATGYQSASSATGDHSASSATGDRSASCATGYRSASCATGYRSASSATGYQSASSATGYQSASSATGNQSASCATGDHSASSATGYRSASCATGYRSASCATGYQSASSATGKNSVALNIGSRGKARADAGGAIVLCNHDDNGNIRHIRASLVGDNGVQPNVWYVLNENAEFVELQ